MLEGVYVAPRHLELEDGRRVYLLEVPDGVCGGRLLNGAPAREWLCGVLPAEPRSVEVARLVRQAVVPVAIIWPAENAGEMYTSSVQLRHTATPRTLQPCVCVRACVPIE